METKQELRDKIKSLEEEIIKLKNEKKDSEKEFTKIIDERVNSAIKATTDIFYNEWKHSNERFIKRFLLEEQSYKNDVKQMIREEIGKLHIEEYNSYGESWGETGITLKYGEKNLSSVCTDFKGMD